MAFKIIIHEPDGTGRDVEASGPVVTFGRGLDNDVVIHDPRSSRRHCRLSETPHGTVLEDLGSANGTLLRGEAVQKSSVQPGDVFVIGKTRVELRRLPAAPEAPGPDSPASSERPEAEAPGAEAEAPRVSAASAPSSAPTSPMLEEVDVRPPGEERTGGEESDPREAPYVEIVDGPRHGRRVSIETLPFSIGRASRNALTIPSPRVSGAHARILREGDRYVIEDLSSKNGTYVDGRKVERAELYRGARIQIGEAVLDAQVPGEPPVSEEASRDSSRRPTTRRAAAPSEEEGGENMVFRVDVERFQRTHRAQQTLATAAFVTILCLLAYFTIDVSRRVFVHDEVDPPRPGNRISANWSFEEVPEVATGTVVPGWRIEDGDSGKLEITPEEAQYPGIRALRLTGLGSEGFCRAACERVLNIGSERHFVLKGYLSNEGAFLAGYLVDWFADRGGDLRLVGRSYSQCARRGETILNAYRPVVAPPGATQARVACFVYGPGGEAIFDRVSFAARTDQEALEGAEVPRSARAGSPQQGGAAADKEDGAADPLRRTFEIDAGDRPLTVSLRAEGDFVIGRGYRQILSSFWAGLLPDRDPTAFGPRLIPVTVHGGEKGSVVIHTFVPDCTSARWSGVRATVRKAGDQVSIQWQLSEEDASDGPVFALLMESQDERMEALAHAPTGTNRLTFGNAGGGPYDALVLGDEGERTSLEFSEPVQLTSRPHPLFADRWLVVAQPVAGVRDIAVGISAGSRREAQAASSLVRDAEKLYEAGKIAEAIALARRVPELYPEEKEEIQRAEALERQWLTDAARFALELEGAVAELKKSGSPVVYETLLARARASAAPYAGTDVGRRFQRIVAEIEELWTLRAREKKRAEANALLEKAKEHLRGNRLGIAALYAEELISSKPPAEVLRQAENIFQQLQRRQESGARAPMRK